jgi:uncharacterized membrane protein
MSEIHQMAIRCMLLCCALLVAPLPVLIFAIVFGLVHLEVPGIAQYGLIIVSSISAVIGILLLFVAIPDMIKDFRKQYISDRDAPVAKISTGG